MKKVIKRIFHFNFIFYLFLLIVLLYVGVSFAGVRGHTWTNLSLLDYIKNSSNFVPFKTIHLYIRAMFDGSLHASVSVKNLLGNLLLFSQMGIYLPSYIKKLNKLRSFVLSMTALLFIVEVTQLVTRRGSFDIDDFILNMLGALIGYRIWKIKSVQKFIRKLT